MAALGFSEAGDAFFSETLARCRHYCSSMMTTEMFTMVRIRMVVRMVVIRLHADIVVDEDGDNSGLGVV